MSVYARFARHGQEAILQWQIKHAVRRRGSDERALEPGSRKHLQLLARFQHPKGIGLRSGIDFPSRDGGRSAPRLGPQRMHPMPLSGAGIKVMQIAGVV